MKTLNVRLVLILLGCVVVFGGAMYGVNRFQKKRNAYVFKELADEAIERAKAAEEEGNLLKAREEKEEALDNLRWYLNLEGDDIDTFEEYALLSAEVAVAVRSPARMNEAVVLFEEVLRKDSTRDESRRKLVDLAIMVGQIRLAKMRVGELLVKSPTDGELLAMSALCQTVEGELDAAVTSYRQAIRYAPDKREYYVRLASLLWDRLKRHEEADQCMVDLVFFNRDFYEAHFLRGEYLRRTGELYRESEPLELTEEDRRALSRTIDTLAEHRAGLAEAVAAFRESELGTGDALAEAVDAVKTSAGSADALAAARAVFARRRGALAGPEQTVSQCRVALEQALGELKLREKPRAALTETIEGLKWKPTAPDALEAAAAALEANPDDRAALAKVLAIVEEEADALKNATDLFVRAPDALVSAVKVLSGSRGAYEEALEALRLKEDDADVIWLAAHCAAVSEDYDRARTLAQRGIDLHPRTVKMYHTLADVEVRCLHEELAAERDQAALANWGKVAEHRTRAVEHRDKALAALRQGLGVVKDDPDLLWTLTNLLIDACRIEDFEGQANAGSAVEVDAERLQEAQKTLDRLRVVEHRIIPEAMIDYLQARIEYEQEHWMAAARGFEQSRPGLVGRPRLTRTADVQLSKCYWELQLFAKQEAVLERILEEYPFYAPALAALADLKMFNGEPEEALEEFDKLVAQNKLPAAGWLPLARMLLLKNMKAEPSKRNWQEVLDALAKAAEVMPGSHQVVLLTAEVSRARAREQLVRAQLLTAEAEKENVPAQKQQLLLERQQALSQAEAHYQAAEKLLLEARNKSPQITELWAAMVALALRREAWDQAKAILEQAEKSLGDKVELRLSRAVYLTQRPQAPAADELRALAENTGALTRQEQVRLFSGLLEVAFRTGDVEQGRRLCRRIAALEPNNVRVRLTLLETALRVRDESTMETVEEALAEIHTVEGEGPHWLWGQAVRSSLQAFAIPRDAADDAQTRAEIQEKLGQAQQYLDRARQLRRNWSRVPALAAAIYEQQGDARKALENYLAAIDLGETNPMVLTRALKLLYQNRQFEKAQEVTEKFAGRTDMDSDAGRIKPLLDWERGDTEAALSGVRDFARGSQEYHDHLMHGRLAAEMARRDELGGQTDRAGQRLKEAEQAFRRAVELASNTSETWVELIRLLAATGQKQEALAAVEEARSKVPPQQLPLALARFYAVSGENDRADAQFREVLAAAPDDPIVVRSAADFFLVTNKVQEGEQLLRRLTEGSVRGSTDDVVWARRRLAAILSNRPDFPSRVEAIALIEKNREQTDSAIEDLRLLGSLLTGHPNRNERARGIEIFKEIVQLPSVIPEDRFILAQLYLAQKDWFHANEQFVALLTMPGGSQPRYFAASIRALLANDNTEEAARRLTRLEQVAPHDFTTVDLRAAVAFARDEYANALGELTKYVGDNTALPSDPAVRLYQAAFRLEQLAARLARDGKTSQAALFLGEAESMFRKFVRDRMGQELVLASFLGRQGKLDEALAWIERHWAENRPEQAAGALGYVLKNSALTPAQSRRGEAVVHAALQKFNRPLDLLLVLGDAMTLQQRYVEAEKYYRECLAKSDRDARVMNNLAMFLALQKRNLDEALELINGAIEIQGPTPAMFDSRASVYLAMGEPGKALADLNAALSEEIKPTWLFRQALAYDRIGRPETAAVSLRMAVEQEGLTAEMLLPDERAVYQEMKNRLL
ncbi:MAG TPA: hypothetical protein VMY42_19855 [Thermoguttaceae bacterium]|nr:hypothetical protein [Thermoguttaceae bacterium]